MAVNAAVAAFAAVAFAVVLIISVAAVVITGQVVVLAIVAVCGGGEADGNALCAVLCVREKDNSIYTACCSRLNYFDTSERVLSADAMDQVRTMLRTSCYARHATYVMLRTSA